MYTIDGFNPRFFHRLRICVTHALPEPSFKKMHTLHGAGERGVQYRELESDGTNSYLWIVLTEWIKSLTPEERWKIGVVPFHEYKEIKRKFKELRKIKQRLESESLDEADLAEIDSQLLALAP